MRAEGLPGPVPLLIALGTEGDGRRERVQLPPEGGSWTFETTVRPRVELNGDRGLLARIERGSGQP